MTALPFNVASIEPAWKSLQTALPAFAPVHSEEHYHNLVEVMNSLLDVVGDSAIHPLAGLLELTGKLIDDYENSHYAIPQGTPRQTLKFLMDSNQLKQSDLAAEIGGQSVVSAILSGNREINIRQAKALAARFGVAVAVFIG